MFEHTHNEKIMKMMETKKNEREKKKSEMRNCARIIYGNMLYLNDHFC